MRDAERIFYRALAAYLVRNSQFIDVRLAAVLAAAELFGDGSPQAERTAEAFDAVEIFDGGATPEPPDFPGVSGTDATVYVYYDVDEEDYFLARQDSGLGDPAEGISLSGFPVSPQRPSVTGDGSTAVFVSAFNDACTIPTDASSEVFEECIGAEGSVYSATVSPDGSLFAFVLQDDAGQPQNTITVVDTTSGAERTFPLRAPLIDGQAIGTVLFAEVMDFTADSRFLLYDAFDQIALPDGGRRGFYSVYALDLENDRTLLVVDPDPGVDVGNPSLAQTSDNYLVLDVVENGVGRVVAVNLSTGEAREIAVLQSQEFFVGIPTYTGDDAAVVYTQADDDTALGLSLFRQVVDDRLAPKGTPTLWLSDAAYGVVYRRGTFVGPEATPTPSATATPRSTPTRASCVGDCDTDGVIGDGEVREAIVRALIGAGASCPGLDRNEDGRVTVEEAVATVIGNLHGCIGRLGRGN
jgi:hypothetical protein